MSQLQAEMALLVQNDSKHKMHLAEMGQSVAMTRNEASRLREQIMTKDNEFRKVLRELERALDEAHSKVPSTNEVICALQVHLTHSCLTDFSNIHFQFFER